MSRKIDPVPTHEFGLCGIDRDSPYRAMLLDFIERQGPVPGSEAGQASDKRKVGGQRRHITTEEVEGHCQPPRQAYATSEAGPYGFRVFGDPAEPATTGALAGWLKQNV